MKFKHRLVDMGIYLGRNTKSKNENIEDKQIYINRANHEQGYIFQLSWGKYCFLNENDIKESVSLIEGKEYALCFKEDESENIIYYIVEAEELRTPIPQKGDKIYVNASLHIDRGEDDVQGGLATIKNIYINDESREFNRIFVTFEEVKGYQYNYRELLMNQEKYKKRYGETSAKNDPDYAANYYW